MFLLRIHLNCTHEPYTYINFSYFRDAEYALHAVTRSLLCVRVGIHNKGSEALAFSQIPRRINKTVIKFPSKTGSIVAQTGRCSSFASLYPLVGESLIGNYSGMKRGRELCRFGTWCQVAHTDY